MTSNLRRLPSGGNLINREAPLTFHFNGRKYTGYSGDTLASALMASGVDVLSRSFKYHRRRGLQSFGYADVSSMVQLCGDDDSPNVLASVQALYQGLQARSVNCWPNVNYDIGSVLALFSPILPAGFYYKTFMWPHWQLFEPLIRKAAGFGTAPSSTPNRPFHDRFDHCDVLVVGAGPAGLMAALTAAKNRARVLLVDEMNHPGGSLLYSRARIDGSPASQWVEGVIAKLNGLTNVTILQNATAWGYLEGNMVCISERFAHSDDLAGRNWKVWANQVVLATGAIERPIIFPNNDSPGVMLSSAVRSYISEFAVAPGEKAVLFTNNDYAYLAIADFNEANIEVAAVVDVREQIDPKLHQSAIDAGAQIHTGHLLEKAVTRGGKVKGAVVSSRNSRQSSLHVDCDLICVSGGWNPAVHLFSQSRGSLKFDEKIASLVPDQALQQTHAAGGINGIFTLTENFEQGAEVGAAATHAAGFTNQLIQVPTVSDELVLDYGLEVYWSTDSGDRQSKAFVDLAGDVTVFDLRLAVREGYGEIEHLKRYTTTGMGLDQGKTANINAIGIISENVCKHPSDIGNTTFRPPYTPVEFGSIAGSRQGQCVLPYRHTPMTDWHIAHGAVMYEAGAGWRRPGYYLKPRESMDAAVRRECQAVRKQVAIYDGTPLGKFELKGPDVLRLLNLVYTNSFDSLKTGQGRYGIMLTEDGLVFDDGVTFRIGDDRYLMTCSTGGARLVERKLDRLIHIDHPELDVGFTTVTEQWSNATVCGPMARQMLESSDSDIDFSRRKLPFMRMCEGTLAGLPVRIFRVSFTGELSFEINTPSRYGLELWKYLMKLGERWEIHPIGSESNHVLRVEKGFLSLAHEVDGTVDPIDLGMDWIVNSSKPDFIGKRAMEIRRRSENLRKELVGLLPHDSRQMMVERAPLVLNERSGDSDGLVSAAVWSEAIGRTIALGLLTDGRKRKGDFVFASTKHGKIPAIVTDPIFYDPDGLRLRM